MHETVRLRRKQDMGQVLGGERILTGGAVVERLSKFGDLVMASVSEYFELRVLVDLALTLYAQQRRGTGLKEASL